jgi:capsular polysaccharide biosynthesis protein
MEASSKAIGSRSVFDVLSRRRVVAIVVLGLGVICSIALALFIKPNYAATAHLLLVNDTQGRDPEEEGADMPRMAASTTVLDPVRSQLHLDEPTDELRKFITIKVAPKSSIMTIATKDHDPARAVTITNAVAESFVSFYSSISGGRYAKVIGQLRADLAGHRERMQILESRLQQAAVQSSYVGSQASLDNTANALNDLVTQRTMAFAQLVSDRAELSASRSQPGKLSKIIRHETLANDQGYRQLEIGVSHDSANLAMNKASYTDKFPGLAGEEAKVNSELIALHGAAVSALNSPSAYSPSLGGQIVAEQRAESAVAGDEARVMALDAQIASTKTDLKTIPSSGVNVGSIRALRDAEEAQYQALALRLSNAEANSAEANSLGSVVIIDHAESAEPTLLTTNALLILSLLLSLGLAIAAAYFAESVNPRLINSNDVESIYGRPVVGSINAK